MKIIAHDTLNGEAVYVQVKDLLYLGRVLGNKEYVDEYINLLNSQKKDYEFIRVYGKEKETIINRSDIVDFKDAYSQPESFLSRTLINLTYGIKNSEEMAHRCEDIRDVLSFKRGDLSYTIPLISDGDIHLFDANSVLEFSSTILPDCYVLRTRDGSLVSDCDYQIFFEQCLEKLRDCYDEKVRNDFQMQENSTYIVIKFYKRKNDKVKCFSLLKKIKTAVTKKED